MPLSTLYGEGGQWRESDRKLAVALTIYERSLCPTCGHVMARSHDPEMDGWYDAHEDTCYACAAVDLHTAGQKDPTPGAKVYVTENEKAPKDLPGRPTPRGG